MLEKHSKIKNRIRWNRHDKLKSHQVLSSEIRIHLLYTFSIKRPRFGIFQNFFSLRHIQIQHPKLSLDANFHDLSVSEFDFMRITNLKIYKEFDRE